jgi:TM2 domain-containing membrane protein YozV
MADIYQILPELQGDELIYVSSLLKNLDDQTAGRFASLYRARRKDPQTVLLLSLLGFIGVAGVHRFFLEQVGMGLLFFFTGGICLIGTIIDVVNHKSLAFEFNQKKATETMILIRGTA